MLWLVTESENDGDVVRSELLSHFLHDHYVCQICLIRPNTILKNHYKEVNWLACLWGIIHSSDPLRHWHIVVMQAGRVDEPKIASICGNLLCAAICLFTRLKHFSTGYAVEKGRLSRAKCPYDNNCRYSLVWVCFNHVKFCRVQYFNCVQFANFKL